MKFKDRSGFTIIEVVLVITITVVLSLGLASFILSAMDSWVFVKSRQSALSEGRSTVERMIREIRRIRQPSSIGTAESSAIGFVDIDSRDIDFRQSGSDLLRTEQGNSNIIASGVLTPEGLVMSYYDAGLNPTAIHQNIHYVKVRLTLVKGKETVILEDGARIRNL
ncbi:MAG: prepilin-type N-terminal cleavage/methylation domain-containing protein [Candidatus Margulisiibacteriota bacterium]